MPPLPFLGLYSASFHGVFGVTVSSAMIGLVPVVGVCIVCEAGSVFAAAGVKTNSNSVTVC